METQPDETVDWKKHLKERLKDKQTLDFFGLTESEVEDFINTLKSSQGVISPGFLSPGFGSNNSREPRISTTFLNNRPDTYLHEARHGLHYKTCCVIYERQELRMEAFGLFCENVLGDREFIEFVEKKGSKLQREFIRKAKELQERHDLLPDEISKLAVELGALTYQHAYFVDPRMCEAVASYGDTGITRTVGLVNRSLAKFIPNNERLPLRGYGDKEYQSIFGRASLLQKALLVKSREYSPRSFWQE